MSGGRWKEIWWGSTMDKLMKLMAAALGITMTCFVGYTVPSLGAQCLHAGFSS